ncbi:diguanylate cyclase [Halomonas sp. PAMB 3264]|uniref:diguanylate cyclase domain-containing protein n=1 Tax=Halomonas sp. PAMB 3264 TaxID=3075222 RepID=UPI00289E78B1|nr:diguanylate cyclase [Halomonas sp. PAMB 3264]WNL43185.1 diguanylate cyclase [Halomonas sp. PAMB 3264]
MLYGDGNNRPRETKAFKKLALDADSQGGEAAWVAEKSWAHVTLNSITDAVLTTDMHGRVTYLNRVAEALIGWSRVEAAGKPVEDILSMVDSHTYQTMVNPAIRAMIEDRAQGFVLGAVLIHRDGSQREIESSAVPVHNLSGMIVGAVVVFHDACQSHIRSAQFAYQAQHDPLTSLPNRFLFADRLARAVGLAKRHQHKMALIYLDMDHFKAINDTFGHALGDRYLQIVAERLSGCIRTTDTVCRQGGDEFVVLLSEIESVKSALNVASKILTALATPCQLAGHEHTFSASIGVSIYPDHSTDEQALLHYADLAMYCAKQNGRQQCRLYLAEMEERQS